jgi:hypothetical protein
LVPQASFFLLNQGAFAKVLELLYTAPWLPFYSLEKVSGQRISFLPQDCSSHPCLTKMKVKDSISMDSKLLAIILFHFLLFFQERDSFISKSFFVVHQIFTFSA